MLMQYVRYYKQNKLRVLPTVKGTVSVSLHAKNYPIYHGVLETLL